MKNQYLHSLHLKFSHKKEHQNQKKHLKNNLIRNLIKRAKRNLILSRENFMKFKMKELKKKSLKGCLNVNQFIH
jgi:hypothetical protein